MIAVKTIRGHHRCSDNSVSVAATKSLLQNSARKLAGLPLSIVYFAIALIPPYLAQSG